MAATPPVAQTIADLQAFYDKRVADQEEGTPGYGAAWKELVAVILGHGGVAVVPPTTCEDDIPKFLGGGCVERQVRLVKGPPSRCHTTTATYWEEGKLDAIVTGYALTRDGLWRQHSWGLSDGTVIEPTMRRVAYFGIELRGAEADNFAGEVLFWD
jgi:hypothetical protein